MKIKILDLPPELYQEIISWLDLKSSQILLSALNLETEYAFRYCQFQRPEEYIKLTCISLQRLIDNNPRNFNALVMNKNFRSAFNCAEAFIIAAYCGFNQTAEIIIANRHAFNYHPDATRDTIQLDLGRNMATVSIAQAIHGIQFAFSNDDTDVLEDLEI